MTVTDPAARTDEAVDRAWRGFATGPWQDRIDVRDFIQRNYMPYLGDARFLAGPTERTTGIWQQLSAMFPVEREKGVIHTALDTSGFLGVHASDALLEDTSLVLLDVKSGDPDVYRETTTRELQPTIDFGDRLAGRGTPVWVRFVLVPGLTDGADNVEQVADIVMRWPNVERVEVLPFHQLGRSKWDRLGREYTLVDITSPEPELVERVRGQFRARGLEVY